MNQKEIDTLRHEVAAAIESYSGSIIELADRVGVSKVTIHNWKNGNFSNIKIDNFRALADVTGTTFASFSGAEPHDDVGDYESLIAEKTRDNKAAIAKLESDNRILRMENALLKGLSEVPQEERTKFLEEFTKVVNEIGRQDTHLPDDIRDEIVDRMLKTNNLAATLDQILGIARERESSG